MQKLNCNVTQGLERTDKFSPCYPSHFSWPFSSGFLFCRPSFSSHFAFRWPLWRGFESAASRLWCHLCSRFCFPSPVKWGKTRIRTVNNEKSQNSNTGRNLLVIRKHFLVSETRRGFQCLSTKISNSVRENYSVRFAEFAMAIEVLQVNDVLRRRKGLLKSLQLN